MARVQRALQAKVLRQKLVLQRVLAVEDDRWRAEQAVRRDTAQRMARVRLAPLWRSLVYRVT